MSKELLKKTVKPSMIDVSKDFWDTILQNCEGEMVARNIVILSKNKNNDKWLTFTWESYCEMCGHTPNHYDSDGLGKLVEHGGLIEKDGEYTVTDTFIAIIHKFIKE